MVRSGDALACGGDHRAQLTRMGTKTVNDSEAMGDQKQEENRCPDHHRLFHPAQVEHGQQQGGSQRYRQFPWQPFGR